MNKGVPKAESYFEDEILQEVVRLNYDKQVVRQ
jgi:hypothetical protein